MELIAQHESVLWPQNLFRLALAWGAYMRVELKLSIYEYYLSVRRKLGMEAGM